MYDNRRHMASSLRDMVSSYLVASRSTTRDSGTGGHEFAHDMRRVSASYNSPHIATNVHELCHKRFGQNCSTSSIRHVHDIHDEI